MKLNDKLFGKNSDENVSSGRKFFMANMILFGLFGLILLTFLITKVIADTIVLALIGVIPLIFSIYVTGNVMAKKIIDAANLEGESSSTTTTTTSSSSATTATAAAAPVIAPTDTAPKI